VGTIVGAYEISGELGRGGMGVVYRARHVPTGVERALKVVAAGASATAVERFKREVEALARLGRAGVVAIHETGISSGRAYYAMELMPGGSLRARLEARGKLSWRDAALIGAELARTLERCHALGLVHRDLKPENILFDEHDAPRVADFGCVKDLAAVSLTKPGGLVGTLSYMAPEQMQGLRADARADVYALAVIVHELVTGRHPYAQGQTVLEFIANRERVKRAHLEPEALDAVLDRALEVKPEARTPTARAFREELEAVLEGRKVASRRRKMRPWVLAAALGGAVALAAIAATRRPSRAVDPEAALAWAEVAGTLASVDSQTALVAALAATTIASTSSDAAIGERAWEARARVAAAAWRHEEATLAAARALELLGRTEPQRAHALVELRIRSLAALGRDAEIVALAGDRVEDERLAAEALSRNERWKAVRELPPGDPLVDVRRAWASHALGAPIEELVAELEKIRDLPPSARAAVDVLHARVDLRKLVDGAKGYEVIEKDALRPLLVFTERSPLANPGLREPSEELAVIEQLLAGRLAADVPGETVAPIDAAMRAVAGPYGDVELAPLRVLLFLRLPRLDTELRRSLLASMRERVPARYALTRAIAIAREAEHDTNCEVRSDLADLLAVCEEACRPPDAGDVRIGRTIMARDDLEPRSIAAVAALVLAADAEGEERAALIACAHEHMEKNVAETTATNVLAERAIVRVMVALAEGQDPGTIAKDPNLDVVEKDTEFIRGELRRVKGRKGSSIEHLVLAESTETTCSCRFISNVVRHDLPIARALYEARDESAPPAVRAEARRRLGTVKPACLPWIRMDVKRALGEKP
jgi:hypothetical protein